MISASTKINAARAQAIIKMLQEQDREVVEAYYADLLLDARRGRPVVDFAKAIGIWGPIIAGIVCVLYFVVPRVPRNQCEECSPVPECPSTNLDWGSFSSEVQIARRDNMLCLWPTGSPTFSCTVKLDPDGVSIPQEGL